MFLEYEELAIINSSSYRLKKIKKCLRWPPGNGHSNVTSFVAVATAETSTFENKVTYTLAQ
jgi:hypothetical protein